MNLGDEDECVFCGALALRSRSGEVVAWATTLAADSRGHDHETIDGDT